MHLCIMFIVYVYQLHQKGVFWRLFRAYSSVGLGFLDLCGALYPTGLQKGKPITYAHLRNDLSIRRSAHRFLNKTSALSLFNSWLLHYHSKVFLRWFSAPSVLSYGLNQLADSPVPDSSGSKFCSYLIVSALKYFPVDSIEQAWNVVILIYSIT